MKEGFDPNDPSLTLYQCLMLDMDVADEKATTTAEGAEAYPAHLRHAYREIIEEVNTVAHQVMDAPQGDQTEMDTSLSRALFRALMALFSAMDLCRHPSPAARERAVKVRAAEAATGHIIQQMYQASKGDGKPEVH